MSLMKIAALTYLILYYGVLLAFRSYLLYKNTGINPVKNMEKKGIAGFIEKVFTVCFISVSIIVLNFVFLENNYLWLIPIHYLENVIIGYIGIILSIIGLSTGFVAQLQMGDSWRLGLNKKEKTILVYRGLFKYSRNPIYLGLMLSNIGLFLMMPNALSFAFMVVSYVALEVKIRLEEQYLMNKHSNDYTGYMASVRRWI